MTRIVTSVLFLAAAGGLAAQTPEIGPAPGTLVDVGGRKLHLLCSGAGAPTVVIEAGASSFAIDFTLVQQEVSKTNRVCSYDRAGHGWSDRSTPATRATQTEDLHKLLEASAEPGPYLLVGASAGGLYVRTYTAEHPEQVVGLVLIDPATEDRLFTMYRGDAVEIASLTAEQLKTTIPDRTVRVPRRQPQTGAPFDRLPAELYRTRITLDTRLIASQPDSVTPEMILDNAERERARLAALKEARAKEKHPLGDRPMVVLTRGVDAAPAVAQVHAALAALSTNSRHTVAGGSGHEIHLFEPEAVILAIADVVEAVRMKTPLPPR